jgi:hypothetical protein
MLNLFLLVIKTIFQETFAEVLTWYKPSPETGFFGPPALDEIKGGQW